MERKRIDINSIDISKATPEQIASAKSVLDLPWTKHLFKDGLSFEKALRYEIHRDMTVVIKTATQGNITALFGLPFQPK